MLPRMCGEYVDEQQRIQPIHPDAMPSGMYGVPGAMIMGHDLNVWMDDIDMAIINGDFELNEWEAEFYESIKEQIDAGRNLTSKQINCLEKIHQKATEGETYR